jgi:hypothetical protein
VAGSSPKTVPHPPKTSSINPSFRSPSGRRCFRKRSSTR